MRIAPWLLVSFTACVYGDPPRGLGGTEKVVVHDFPTYRGGALDVLFVVDDSPAMAAYHDGLLARAAPLIEELEQSDANVDLRVGAIAADPAIGGVFRQVDGVTGPFISDEARPDGTRVRNVTGSLGDAFVRELDVGTSGTPYTQPLEMAARALADNHGFLDEDGYLAIVIIAAQDDASLGAVADYAASFQSFEHAYDVGVAVVSPVVPRLRSLLDAFPLRSTWENIANLDLQPVLGVVPTPLDVVIGSPCIEEPLVQPLECTVSDVNAQGEQVIAHCDDAGVRPCWRLDPDPAVCTGAGHLRFAVDRDVWPPRVNHVVLQCLAE